MYMFKIMPTIIITKTPTANFIKVEFANEIGISGKIIWLKSVSFVIIFKKYLIVLYQMPCFQNP